jgi:hypothetical protein
MGSRKDLDRAVAIMERAIESTPDGHPDLATHLNNLGNALKSRFEHTGSIEDLNRAITKKEQAFASDTAPPSIRLDAASSCSTYLSIKDVMAVRNPF